ncbi:A16A1 dehydrogenase, partial [Aegithalos caudatus]|nr:A16A1 dehydrogenase [Aegithalos caudatus]
SPQGWWPWSWGVPARCQHCCGNWGRSWPWEELQALVWGSPCRGPRLGAPWGGRIVVIVLDSADLDSAAAAIAATAATPPALFPCGGCVVLAQESVVASLERRLRARLMGLRLGDPMDPKTEVGPLPPGTCPPQEVVQEVQEEGAQVRGYTKGAR